MREEYKPITGYENLYLISNFGNVYSLRRKKQLRKHLTKKGYLKVTLCDNKKRKSITVHRLVAIEFVENIKNKPCVNHVDGIKTNNNFKNLEWVTESENTQHAYDNNLIKKPKGERHPLSKLNKNKVYTIAFLIFHTKVSTLNISRIYNVHRDTIWSIKSKRNWRHLNIIG